MHSSSFSITSPVTPMENLAHTSIEMYIQRERHTEIPVRKDIYLINTKETNKSMYDLEASSPFTEK